ncbi:MAG: acetyl-CoA C-acyltransferase [Gammaproteobacteria bacterium]|nr:acetyl-CoA C-acyltransferase [Gammaproteobacteria bacterium]
MQKDPIVIVSAVRTPMGAFQGKLSPLAAPDLGAIAISAVLERGKWKREEVDEVIMGCVLSAGQGQAPARQAALEAKLPHSVGCTTINKMCGSGMKAVMISHDLLIAESAAAIVAGGLESMSNAPYLLPRVRRGLRLGHSQVLDHMFLDGLEDAYEKGNLMGVFAERCAEKYQFTRKAQDDYAITSLTRAWEATESGAFNLESTHIQIKAPRGELTINQDELPAKSQIENIPKLSPVFKADGTVTAANASSISDGAAALLLMKKSTAKAHKLKPLAEIVGFATHAQAPAWFTTAPIPAIQKLLKKVEWDLDNIDLFEINEAFAVVPMAAMQELKIPHAKVNVNGGACALGHPIGASGARILVTLIYALKQKNLKKGVASLCIGGGEACAMAIEICES